MSTFRGHAFLLGLVLLVGGCSESVEEQYGAKVDNFDGQLVHNGEPVSFPEGSKVVLQLVFLENGDSFGIPIKPDGSFDIGWMPIGEYAARLERTKPAEKGSKGGARPDVYTIPGGLTIAEGQTEYKVELGEGFRP